ncbi:MAG: polysaccharide deacetylase family protein [bacterium]|nr:polysaccharide deacetylase family protein [bacterium]
MRRYALRASLRYRRFERSMGKLTGGGFIRLITIGLLLVILYQSGILVKIVREIPVPSGSSQTVPAFPTAELVHEGEWFTVAGRAPGFGVAVLIADGRERDVCTVREGYFSFTFQAEGPMRSVQIQVYGDRLPAMYTRALPLPDNLLASGDTLPEVLPPAAQPARTRESKQAREVPVKTALKPEPPVRPAEAEQTAAAGPSPQPGRKPGDDIDRGLSGSRTVAVTFDGGSYSNAAARILDVLAQRNLKATFFLTGEFMRSYPEITRRIADEGHEVGNHTYSHLHLTTFEKNFRQDILPGITREILLAELKKNEAFFEELTGRKMVSLWRAPYGEQNETIRRWASSAGYQHVSWTYDPKTRKNLDGLDWVSDRGSALYLSSGDIVDKILSFDSQTEMGLGGGIVLLHLGSERKADPFYPRLGQLIDKLREKGYEVGSVGALLEKGG